MSNYLMQDVVQVQRFNTGIVIPVYFPAGVDPDTGATLLPTIRRTPTRP